MKNKGSPTCFAPPTPAQIEAAKLAGQPYPGNQVVPCAPDLLKQILPQYKPALPAPPAPQTVPAKTVINEQATKIIPASSNITTAPVLKTPVENQFPPPPSPDSMTSR
jgi:hypothetical protein